MPLTCPLRLRACTDALHAVGPRRICVVLAHVSSRHLFNSRQLSDQGAVLVQTPTMENQAASFTGLLLF